MYRRHGTTMETRLHVFDKLPTPPGHDSLRGICATAGELLALIGQLPPRQQATPSLPPGLTVKPAATLKKPAPAPVVQPAVQPRPATDATGIELSYDIIADAKPRATSIDALYEPYMPERISIPGAHPHPDKIVQSAAMASVLPPIPTLPAACRVGSCRSRPALGRTARDGDLCR